MSELLIELVEPVGIAVAADTPTEVGIDVYPEAIVTSLEVSTSEFIEITEVGPQGAPGPAGSTFVHVQTTPAATWPIVHNLNTILSVVLILDSDPGEPVITDVTYPDMNTVVISLLAPDTGKAYLR